MSFCANKNIPKLNLCLVVLLFHGTGLYSQTKAKETIKHLLVLPTAFYTPETRVGLGGIILTSFKLSNDSCTKKSFTQTYYTFTQNKQTSFENDYLLWTRQNEYLIRGSFDYKHFPNYFYGIGNNTKEYKRIPISYEAVKFLSKVSRQIAQNTYLGAVVNFQKVFNHNSSPSSIEMCREIYGEMGYAAFGLGANLLMDKRNNIFNPSKGYYVEAGYTNYNKSLNEYCFTNFYLDTRKYTTLFNWLIWNGSFYLNSNKGYVPYLLLPEIGGARLLRGYFKGRFRDNNLYVINSEFRMPIYKFIGVALFGGIGAVSQNLNQLHEQTIRYNYGAGLRIRINKKDNSNLRIDYGLTKDSKGFYVVFAEAF